MTTTRLLTDILPLSVRNEVYVLVNGREAMVVTGGRTSTGLFVTVQFEDRTSLDLINLPLDTEFPVIRVLS